MTITADPRVLDHKLRALARSCRERGLDARKAGAVVILAPTNTWRYLVGDNGDGQWLWQFTTRDFDLIDAGRLHTPILGATTDAAAELVDVLAGRQD